MHETPFTNECVTCGVTFSYKVLDLRLLEKQKIEDSSYKHFNMECQTTCVLIYNLPQNICGCVSTYSSYTHYPNNWVTDSLPLSSYFSYEKSAPKQIPLLIDKNNAERSSSHGIL